MPNTKKTFDTYVVPYSIVYYIMEYSIAAFLLFFNRLLKKYHI